MIKRVKIKKILCLLLLYIPLCLNAQVATIAGDYKIIDIGNNGVGDYTRNLILIHEIYNGTLVGMNNAVGTITAFRGNQASFNRINVMEINSSSAYNGTYATIRSFDDNSSWSLKTCTYNNRKYLAVDVPYTAAYHNWGFKFAGWTTSTSENMKSIAYQVSGSAVNTTILSDIQDYLPNMTEMHHVSNFLVMGNVGIGTPNPDEKLTVKGKIHAQEVRIDMIGALVPDYVFTTNYKLKTLQEVEAYINKNSHLPEIPSAAEFEKNGMLIAEINISLLKKIEEMTLYLIQQDKKLNEQSKEIATIKNVLERLSKNSKKNRN
jgi:hypothetical protein